MSDDATVKFGYDGSQLNSGLLEAEKKISHFGSKAETSLSRAGQQADHFEKSMRTAGGSGMRNMGQVSMQIQDIAVQLQGGTKASIVFAQQGSQMLSAFGAAGAVVGGIAAVGAAIYTMGQNARESFDKIIESSQTFRAESALLVQSTNADNLAGSLMRVREQMNAINHESKTLNTFMGDFGARVGGGDVSSMQNQLMEEKTKQAEIYGRMVDRALLSSKQELDISNLIVAGKKDEAESLQRSYALQNKIASIGQLKIQDWAKQKLIADETQKAANADSIASAALDKKATDKKEAETKRIETAQKHLNETRQKAAEEEMTTAERIADVKQRLEAPVDAKKGQEQQIQAEEEKIQLQMVLNRLLKEQTRETEAAAKKEKDLAKEKDDREKASLKAYEDRQRRQKDIDTSRNDGMRSLEELRLRARGNDKGADKLLREKKLEDTTKYWREMGASEEFARQKAEETLRLEDKIEARRSGKASHIGGVTKKTMMGSGIDQFNRNQEKEYETTDPARPGYQRGRPRPMHDAFSRGEPTSAQRTGRYMGGERAGTRDYSQTETYKTAQSKNEAANSGSGGVASKIDKSNEHLSTIAAALV